MGTGITPEALLGAPRLSPLVPNHDFTKAFYTESTHDFTTNVTSKQLRVQSLQANGRSDIIIEGFTGEATWIPNRPDELLHLKPGEMGTTEVKVINTASKDSYQAAKIDASLSNAKLHALKDGSIVLVVTGLLGDDGRLHNPEAAKPHTTGRIFDTVRIRSWNTTVKDHPYTLWYTKLDIINSQWVVNPSRLFNVVPDQPFEAPFGMYDTFSPLDNFSICDAGIALTVRDVSSSPLHSEYESWAFFAPLDPFDAPPSRYPIWMHLPEGVGAGASTNIRFSPEGSHIAFLHNDNDDPENKKIMYGEITHNGVVVKEVPFLVEDQRHPPDAFEFGGSHESLYVQRQDAGREVLSIVTIGERPRDLLKSGAISAFFRQVSPHNEADKVLVSSSSFLERFRCIFLDVATGDYETIVSTGTQDMVDIGLEKTMVQDFSYRSVDGVAIHSWMLTPPGFDKDKKYPWILMPHGGPESAWTDGWSTRWNPVFYASHGYVVVCPNIAGSTGYGMDLTRRVGNEWAGLAFQDILYLINHLDGLPYLDKNQAVLASASYGAYLISWIMGHDIIKRFHCIIWHDGRFDLPTSLLQSDVFKWTSTFNGSPFFFEGNEANLEKYNPASAERLRNWKHAPPTLVIHGEKDYRCPVGDGIATFRTLQKLGVKSRFLMFEDEGHWVVKPANGAFWLRTILAWMDESLKGGRT